MQTVGMTDITITYSRPGAKGRKIFGGMEPYGTVWRTGANSATVIKFSDEVIMAGKKIPAGEYGFFSIPGEDGKPVAPLYNYLKPYPDELSQKFYSKYGGEEKFSISCHYNLRIISNFILFIKFNHFLIWQVSYHQDLSVLEFINISK